MVIYTNINQAEAQEFLDRYHLGTIRKFQVMEGGSANSSYFLGTEDRKYIFSICDEKSKHEIDNLAKLLNRLEDSNFPATRLVAPVESFQDKPVLIKEYIEGEVPEDWNVTKGYYLGKALGFLNTISTEGIHLPNGFPYGMAFFDEVKEVEHPFVDWLNGKVEKFDAGIPEGLPTGMIHGDIFKDNTVYEGDQLKAVLDFEEACIYPYAFEIGMAIVGTSFEGKDFPFENTKSLIKGYSESRDISQDEKEIIKLFIEYAATATAFWRFRQYHVKVPTPEKQHTHQEMQLIADTASEVSLEEFISKVF